MRQMSYSLCRFWAYDESKKIVGAGASLFPWNNYVNTPPSFATASSARLTIFLLPSHLHIINYEGLNVSFQDPMHLPGNLCLREAWVWPKRDSG